MMIILAYIIQLHNCVHNGIYYLKINVYNIVLRNQLVEKI